MPQMMPINWLISLIMFINIFLLFNIMNYYIYNFKLFNKNSNKIIKTNNYTWKW